MNTCQIKSFSSSSHTDPTEANYTFYRTKHYDGALIMPLGYEAFDSLRTGHV